MCIMKRELHLVWPGDLHVSTHLMDIHAICYGEPLFKFYWNFLFRWCIFILGPTYSEFQINALKDKLSYYEWVYSYKHRL
jgi:hypothetical protein